MFKQVETVNRLYVNRLAMTNDKDWMKDLGIAKGCQGAKNSS